MNHRPLALAAALVALALPTTAVAATPDHGSIAPGSAKTTWSGTITDPIGAYDLAAFFAGSTMVRGQETCAAVVCDPYKLTVGPGGRELRIVVDAPDADNVSMEITDPDGSTFNLNTVDYYSQRTLIWDATPGTWTVRVYGTGAFDSFDYGVTAELNLENEPDFVAPDDGSDAVG